MMTLAPQTSPIAPSSRHDGAGFAPVPSLFFEVIHGHVVV